MFGLGEVQPSDYLDKVWLAIPNIIPCILHLKDGRHENCDLALKQHGIKFQPGHLQLAAANPLLARTLQLKPEVEGCVWALDKWARLGLWSEHGASP